MKRVVHVEKRGKWARPQGPRICAGCSAESDRAKPMPEGWSDHLAGDAHVFTCSNECGRKLGLR